MSIPLPTLRDCDWRGHPGDQGECEVPLGDRLDGAGPIVGPPARIPESPVARFCITDRITKITRNQTPNITRR